MNEEQAEKVIELLEKLLETSTLISNRLGRIEDNIEAIKEDTADLGQLSELPSIKGTLLQIEDTMKRIDERGSLNQ